MLGLSLKRLTVDIKTGEKRIAELLEEGTIKNIETKHLKKDGKVIDILYSSSVIEYNGKTAIFSIYRDITERKKYEDELSKLSTAVQQSPESIIITDPEGGIEYVNRAFIKLSGYNAEEVIGKNPKFLQSGFTPPEVYRQMWESIKSGSVWYGELLNKKKSGELYWQSVSITPIKDSELKTTHFLSVQEDITDKKAQNEKLRNSLKEKETMLREIHHRVKNNLQIILSLLKLQDVHIKDKEDLAIFKDSQNRIRAMALIHQALYNTKNLSSINFRQYIQRLVNELSVSHISKDQKINFDINIDEVYFDIETAIPCGLIVNELVSNSLKYAYKGIAAPNLSISLKRRPDKNYFLSVSDNGRGIPGNIDINHTKTMGLQLVNLLAEQLESEMAYDGSHSTRFTFKFKPLHYKQRI
jgi:PAS domain S-box-containing protein